jgi:DNA-binding response OmpR family regulator
MNLTRVLVIEDDRDIRELLRAILERTGLQVVEGVDGRDGLRRFYDEKPALVLLDVAMPEMDGWQVLERIRELSAVPVLMLTANASEQDTVRGLNAGASDYIVKPFRQQELIARIEALLRRTGDTGQRGEALLRRRATDGGARSDVLSDELVEINFPRRGVTVQGKAVDLTPTEFKLLTVFVRHPNQVLDQDQLLEMVWDQPRARSRQQVKLYVSYLRRKLGAVGAKPIETVRGFGYRYSPDAAQSGPD